jgi:very-short-patch-repair endonuclease
LEFHNKKLQPFARQLRKSLTKAEACLWKYALKAKQLKGYQFRRQRPILQYIADFFCKELMLIIELDGITHDNEDSVVKDIRREENLGKAGFKIVIPSCFQKLKYEFLKAYLVLCPVNQSFTI